MRILVTGSAGFIGFSVAKALLKRGDEVIGIDNFNEYYDPALKVARNAILEKDKNFTLVRGDITDQKALDEAFDALTNNGGKSQIVTRVCHLAAQAGVRHSIDNPGIFLHDNIVGYNMVIEACRTHTVGGLIYASTSAVYGDNKEQPFSEEHRTDNPISIYGFTKKANELQAYLYHKMYGVSCTGLRFFTVYGPWGRPDMALFLFTDAVMHGKTLPIFGQGKMRRDFTYIDDIVSGVIAAIDRNDSYAIYNLGGGKTEELMDYVAAIEKACGKEGKKEFLPMQPGDVVATSADISKAQKMLKYQPKTRIEEGVKKFVEWYREYYHL
ncbi:MAG: UDP-glucuronate 4-epimerase [Candidatus Peregrinibacteria bacterium Greene1014_49]|nr:MAG: UDP-glucuronate 4-epimerase [Candidatus Peregrinibacteria bacterium Greene1014_49]